MKYFIIIKKNSIRVPNKNFLDLGGIPLWKHLIFELVDEQVFIDTDSSDIINECENLNWVKSYKRKQEHIDLEIDENFKVSPVLRMIDRFLDEYVTDENEIIITPHVTSPFIKSKTINDACEKLKEGYDSVQACTSYKEFAYFEGNPINFDPDVVQKTQDLKPILMGNGSFFIFTKKSFRENNNRIGKNPFLYVLNDFRESIEIDTWEDYELAKKFVI